MRFILLGLLALDTEGGEKLKVAPGGRPVAVKVMAEVSSTELGPVLTS